MIQTIIRRHATLGASGYLHLDPRSSTVHSDSGLGLGSSQVIESTGGVAKNLRVKLSNAPGGTATRDFTLWKNGAATALTISFAAADTVKTDTTNTVTYVSTDRLVLKATSTNGPVTSSEVHWSMDLDSDDLVSSWIGTNIGIPASDWYSIFDGENNATPGQCDRLIPFDGTITKMVAGVTLAGFNIGASTTLDLFIYIDGVKQDGTAGTIDTKTTIGPSSTSANTTTKTFALPVTRKKYIRIGWTTTGPAVNTYIGVSIKYESSFPGVSLISTRGGGDPSTTVAYYHRLDWGASTWISSILDDIELICGVTSIGLSHLLATSTVDPGVSPKTRTFAVMDTGSASILTCSITSANPIGSDITNTVVFTSNDIVGPMRHTPASTPTVSGTEYWAMVMYDVGGPPPWNPPPISGGGGFIPPINAPPVDVLPINPKLFVHLTLPNTTQYCFAETPLNDPSATPMPVGGRKVAKLMNVSDFDREGTDKGYKTGGWSFTIADLKTLREWRNIALTATIEGATAVLYAIDDNVRIAGGRPYMLNCGKVTHHEGVTNSMQYHFEVEDALGAKLTDVASDPKFPSHPLLKSEFPGLSPSMDGKFAPIAVGKLASGNGMAPGIVIATKVNLLAALGGPDVDVDILLHSMFAVAGVPEYYYTMSTWGPSEDVTVGWFNRPTPNKATTFYYTVAVAGKTGTTEPTWPTTIGTTVVDGTVTWRCHALDNPDLRFAIPVIAYDAAVLTASFKPNFNIATNQPNQYLDYPVGANARRYGVVTLIRHDFIYARAIREGRILIVADIYGVTPNANGSGNYIDTHEDALVWVTAELVFFDSNGTTYATMPQINGYDVFNDASRVAAKAAAVAALAGGFISAFMLGRGGGQQSGFSLWQECQEGGDLYLGPSRHGQVLFGREDPAATAVLQLNDLNDLDSFNIYTNNKDNKNWQQSRFGYRYVPEVNPVSTPSLGQPLPVTTARNPQWESGTKLVENTAAQTAVGKIKRTNFDNYTTNGSPTALVVMQRKFARYIGPAAALDGQKTFVASGGWGMLGKGSVQLDLFSVLGLTSGLGYGSSGYVAKTAQILKVNVSPMKGKITYTGSVLYPYISTTVT